MRLRTVVGLQDENMSPSIFELDDAVIRGAADAQIRRYVDRLAVGPDDFESRDPPSRNRRSLTKRSVADLQREGDRSVRTRPIRSRLQPEIMRSHEGCDAESAEPEQY